MKIPFLILLPAAVCLLLFLPSHQGTISKYHVDISDKYLSSVNPPAGRTGAPGELNCTDCHVGATQSAAGIVDVTFSGAGDEYVVGDNYTITISIASGTKNGFEMTILDGSDTKAGTLVAGTNSSITTSAGRQYVRHSTSAGILSWTFTWTAPSLDAGDLTMYYAFNKSNAGTTTASDIIYLGQYNLTSALFNTVTEHERTDANYSVYYQGESNKINLNYSLSENSKVILNIQDISGKLMEQIDYGTKVQGNYSENIFLQQIPVSGIYIVSLFIDNNVFNRKISIN